MRKKVLLITPPYHCGVVEVAGRWLPLSFVYLAGATRRAGLRPEIYDAMSQDHAYSDIRRRIQASRPHYVATTACTPTVNDALKVLRLAKEIDPRIITLLGGVHPTFCDEEILSQEAGLVDFILRGEGEETLRELLEALEQGKEIGEVAGLSFPQEGRVCRTPDRPFLEDLDSLELAWDLVDWPLYTYFVLPGSRLGVISSSRGCNHSCTFCSQQRFWQQSWRGRSPEAVVREVEELHQRYKVDVFLIADEYPTQDAARWEELLDRLIAKRLEAYFLMETRVEDILRDRQILPKYRRAGIIHIYIGTEATDQQTLDLMNKEIKVEQSEEAIALINQNGMISETSFVLGLPHETKSSVQRTLKLARRYNPDFAHFLAIAPWPYAPMYEDLKEYIQVFDYSQYNLVEPIIKPKRMTLQEVDQAIVHCYRQFYKGKMRELLRMKDPFKRDYMFASMQLMMNNSFLIKKLGSLGKIPEKVKKYLLLTSSPTIVG